MLLAIDVGNSNVVFGLFDGAALREQWRMVTRRYRLADDMGSFLLATLREQDIAPEAITALALSSVVPQLTPTLCDVARRYFHREAFVIEPGVNIALPLNYDNPRHLGADRAVNVLAAIRRYGGPAIVTDFGTAAKFEVINSAHEYLGGAIAPGLNIVTDSLFAGANLLYHVDLTPAPGILGYNSTEATRSGIQLGYLAMVEGMVVRFKDELVRREPGLRRERIKVIATGGLAPMIASASTTPLDVLDPDLTLQGIRLAYEEYVIRNA